MMIYEAVTSSDNGNVSVDIGVKDGVVKIALKGCPEFVIVGEGEVVTVEFGLAGPPLKAIPLRYFARRSHTSETQKSPPLPAEARKSGV